MLSKNKYCFIPIKCIYKYIFNSRINNTVKIRIESGQFLGYGRPLIFVL